MNIMITTLLEDTAGRDDLIHEHGLSMLVQTDHGSILFDTGQSDAFLKNAEKLSLSLPGELDHVVLSHNHYDHTDGLPFLLEQAGRPLTVHVGSGFFTPKFGIRKGERKFHHASFDREFITSKGHRVAEHHEDVYELIPDVYLVTNFLREADPGWENPEFLTLQDGKQVIDPFNDEVSLVIRTQKGLVLLLGCSHPGVLNIISSVQKRFGDFLYAIIGGTHLVAAKGKRLKKLVNALSSIDHVRLGLSHCTGSDAVGLLESSNPLFFANHGGSQLVFQV